MKLSWLDILCFFLPCSTDKHMTRELATCGHYPQVGTSLNFTVLMTDLLHRALQPRWCRRVSTEFDTCFGKRAPLIIFSLTTILANSNNSSHRLPPTTTHPHGSNALKVLRLPFSTFVADLAACREHREPNVDARADMAS